MPGASRDVTGDVGSCQLSSSESHLSERGPGWKPAVTSFFTFYFGFYLGGSTQWIKELILDD